MTVESNYVIAIAALSDWLKRLTPVFQPMRSKTKTNRTLYASFFPRFERVTGNCSDLWLVHRAVCSCCDWSEWFPWSWFFDSHLKTALTRKSIMTNLRSTVRSVCSLLSISTLFYGYVKLLNLHRTERSRNKDVRKTQGSNLGPLARKPRTIQLCHPCSY